ncbi:uncharacterized protein M6B38_350545 [Iris pallida]|uniref:J domain-containing protein n=1 Tax=Iris pallida TaxID=29817 RepID=A0AAX6GS34_IRIPA|nr:uncharacterized protein M6B38_350545 [Iris pallida]
MECNKEEARRAKEIAERKMQNKDFLGAKKIVLKAQQLFPDLENILQMLTVCDVHCCAEAMINGVMDWYGILQVEQFADELSIKKQYRKLALQLHPDKNKFAGAEAAFKLIGEAHMTLSDRGKRSLYDSKRRPNSLNVLPKQPSHQPPSHYCAKTRPGVPGNFASSSTSHFSNINQQQSSASNSHSFLAMCPRCCQRYEYPRILINRSLRCHRCNSDFVAHELHAQAVPAPGTNSTEPLNHTKNSKQEVPGQQSHSGNSSNAGFQGNVAGGPTVQKSRSSSGINVAHGSVGSASQEKLNGMAGSNPHFKNVNLERKMRESKEKPSAVNAKRKRGRKLVAESSDSDSSNDSVDISTDEETGGKEEQSAGTSTGCYPRRSSRPKQNVTYNEALKDDDLVTPKRSRKGGSSFNTVHIKANSPYASSLHNNDNAKCAVDSSSNGSPGPASFSYPDPEFADFEGERVESKFGAGQVWAVYDDLDAMPRYYVRIREVCAGEFRLHFNWLEHNAIHDTEKVWTKAELPVASGNYILGKSESTRSVQMFSHLMCWEKGTRRITYNIYPRKGEVWALYKDWDFKWSSNADSHKLYEYEVVQILLDFADSSDILVVHHLVKIEGFLSLFMPAIDNGTYKIPSTEVLRFSHKVPSYKLTGAEREGTLKGCLELDVASLPSDFADAFPSISLDNAALKARDFDDAFVNPCRSVSAERGVATCSKNGDSKENIHVIKTAGHRCYSADAVNEDSPNSSAAVAGRLNSPSFTSPLPDTNDYPLGEFHDFEEDKSIEKIKRGQIWALYSDVDQFPKYYAKIRSVEDSTIYASWLELLPRHKDEIMWSKKGLPCGCGRFKVERKVNSFDTTDIFSHMVHSIPGKRDQYDIYPISGEVWALYKGWSIEWTQSDLEKCDYDVVEIREYSSSLIRVAILTKVDGHNTVFMPEKEGDVTQTFEIPGDERLRFSHRIPAFRLTDQGSSKLHGYWELHSLSVPHKFL